MATERLRVILELEAGQYKREARQAATATGQISNEAQRATTSTEDFSRRSRGSMSAVAGAAKTLIAGAAAAAVGSFVKSSIEAASDLQESLNAVNVVFGEAADGINEIGERASESFGLSQRAFNEFAVRFSAFAKQIAERDGRSVVDVVDEMTGRVADFASVHNLSLERAAEVAQSTLAGETEVFRRFGGDVSAAAVEAQALESGIVEVGEAMTEQDKILARYQLFMEQTADTAGDFANTSDDLANQQRTLNAQWEETRAELGEALLPFWNGLVGAAKDLLPALKNLAPSLQETAESFGNMADPLLLIADTADPVLSFFNEINGVLSGSSRWSDAFGGFELLGDFLRGPIGLFGRAKDSADEFFRLMDDGPAKIDGVTTGLQNHDDALRRATSGYGELGDNVGEADRALLNTAANGSAAADALEDVGEEAATATPSVQDYADAIRDVRDALLEAADPAFAAIQAQQRKAEALQELADVLADSESTVDDVNVAAAEAAEAILEADAANAEFGASGKDQGIRAIDEAFDIVNDTLGDVNFTAREVLEALGLIDAQGDIVIGIDIDMDPADRALLNSATAGTPRSTRTRGYGGGRASGGMVYPNMVYPVGEGNKPEVMLIPGDQGRVFSNSDAQALIRAFSQSQGSGEQHFHFHSSGDITGDVGTAALVAGISRRVEVARR